MTLQQWAERYPGDPEALRDALVQECDRLRADNARLRAALVGLYEAAAAAVADDVEARARHALGPERPTL